MTARVALRRLVRALALVAVAFACVLFVRRLDLARLGTALASASLPLVTLAVAINLGQMAIRALFLRALLLPVRRVGVARLFRYNLAMFALNNLLPARAGEWLRIELLRAHEDVPRSTSLAIALVEKLLDALALLVLALPLPLVRHDLPRSIAVTAALVGVAGIIALAGAWLLATRGAEAPGWRGQLARGAAVVRRGGALGRALGWALASHAIDAAMIAVCLAALHLEPSCAASLLVLLGVTLALAVPAAPAGVGSLELGAVAALHLLGVDGEHALAFALVYHAVQVVPVTALGLFALRDAAVRSPGSMRSPGL